MPTPKQLHAMQEYYSRPDFVVNEVIELPSSDEEDEEDEDEGCQGSEGVREWDSGGRRVSGEDNGEDFEPQNEQERQWQREDAARRAAELAERSQASERVSECGRERREDEEQQWRSFQQKLVQSSSSSSKN